MERSDPQAQQRLCEAILTQAHQEADQLLEQAQQEARALLAKAAAEAQELQAQADRRAQAEATRRRDQLLATVPLEMARLRLEKIESLLLSVSQESRRRLRERAGFDYPRALVELAVLALKRMAGEAFVLKLPVADRAALGENLAQAATQRLGPARNLRLVLAEDPTLREAGIILEDTEGRQHWDNRLTARLERAWPELRRQLAESLQLGGEAISTEGHS